MAELMVDMQVKLLQSIIMPTKNFFPSSLLAPTCSSYYPFLYSAHKRPLSDYVTGTLLNCTVPFLNPMTGTSLNCQPLNYSLFPNLSSTMLNCTFLIPVSWITRSLEPPHHSSCITFIEDTDDMQYKVTCPTLQMYPYDGSRRGPDGPVVCAPTCFANAQLDHNPMEHYSCSTSLLLYEPHTSQIAFNRQSPDHHLDALNGHSSISEIDTEDMPLDILGISDISAFSATLDIPASPATLATSALW
jgi:hypothetical protein